MDEVLEVGSDVSVDGVYGTITEVERLEDGAVLGLTVKYGPFRRVVNLDALLDSIQQGTIPS